MRLILCGGGGPFCERECLELIGRFVALVQAWRRRLCPPWLRSLAWIASCLTAPPPSGASTTSILPLSRCLSNQFRHLSIGNVHIVGVSLVGEALASALAWCLLRLQAMFKQPSFRGPGFGRWPMANGRTWNLAEWTDTCGRTCMGLLILTPEQASGDGTSEWARQLASSPCLVCGVFPVKAIAINLGTRTTAADVRRGAAAGGGCNWAASRCPVSRHACAKAVTCKRRAVGRKGQGAACGGSLS